MHKIVYGLLLSFLITTSGFAYCPSSFYGPTSKNEHLYRIALQVRPNPGLSVQQVMIAILNANPSAFNQKNINGLKSGYRLRIPSNYAMNHINPYYALDVVNHQNRQWRGSYIKSTTKPVAKITKLKHSKLHLSKAKVEPLADNTDVAPSKESAPTATKSSVIDIAAEQKRTVKASAASAVNTPTTSLDTTEKSTLSTEVVEKTNNQPAIDNASLTKMNNFITETKNFEQQASVQLANLQQQTKTLESTVAQLNQELRTLTYNFVQLTTKSNNQSRSNFFPMLIESIKQNALGLGIGLLALILLSYLLARSFRPRRAKINKKDEYDYMSSQESIPSKLDLARAYIDMGDSAAAEKALREVLTKGNEDQKKEARDLLGKMNERQ